MSRRYVIVGTGPAGISAAETVRAHDPISEIVLIGEEKAAFYSRPGLAYYLAGEVPERQLYPFDSGYLDRLQLRRLPTRVVHLYPQEHQVELAAGDRLSYDRLLLATGSQAMLPALPGIELAGVVKLDTLDDAREIIRRSRQARDAVVVGGGITALEIAEGLRAQGVRTHYFLRQDRYWSGVLDEAESLIVEKRLEKKNIRLYYRTELAEVIGEHDRMSGVRTRDGRQVECQIVAFAVGVRPRHELASAAGLAVDRGILVNEYLQTSAPDVLAAGDAAQVFDPVSGKAVLSTLWSAAAAQGRAAGLNMAVQPFSYRKTVSVNVTRLAGLTTTIIGAVGGGKDQDLPGIARGDSESWRRRPEAQVVQSQLDGGHLRLLIQGHTLIGAVVMGAQPLSRSLYRLISGRADISPLGDQLLRPGAPLAELIVAFEEEWRKANAAS